MCVLINCVTKPTKHKVITFTHKCFLLHKRFTSTLTLIISTSWSTPLSPGNMGCPSSSSASTQPADQMSMFDV